jgi:hypothetical protein
MASRDGKDPRMLISILLVNPLIGNYLENHIARLIERFHYKGKQHGVPGTNYNILNR